NSKKESYGSNDMAHNYYLEEAKKKTPDQKRNLKPREMSSAKTHHTPNACTPKPRSNNQTSRNWPPSKSCEETLKAVQKADHSRNTSLFLDFKHFVCSTCQKYVFNANNDACITKFLKEVNSCAKIQPNKTRNSNKLVDPTSHTQKPGRKIVTGHSFLPISLPLCMRKQTLLDLALGGYRRLEFFTLLVLSGFQPERHLHLAQQSAGTLNLSAGFAVSTDVDELLNPPPSVVNQAPEAIALIVEVIPPVNADSTGSPSSTTVEQEATSTSNFTTPTETQSLIIPQDVRYDNLDIEVAHMRSDPLFGIPIPEVISE
nr:hypothetical protein [Tanacetum cinerariifolium]